MSSWNYNNTPPLDQVQQINYAATGVQFLQRRINGLQQIINSLTSGIAGVTSFNTRTGVVTLLSADVTSALGFTPGDALTTNPLSQFASTTSAQLASRISDETGSGIGSQLVFSKSPTINGPIIDSIILGIPQTTQITAGGAGGVGITINATDTLMPSVGTFTHTFPEKSGTIALTGDNLGVALATSLSVTSGITSSSHIAGIGYATGAGEANTQSSNKTTTVVSASNSICGSITMAVGALTSGATATFTFTNTSVTASDYLGICFKSGGTLGAYNGWGSSMGAGTCTISVRNVTLATLNEQPVLTFSIIRGVTS